jgi:flagellar biogenesis protein FliO
MTQMLATVAGMLLAGVGAWALWLRRADGRGRGDAIRVVTSRYLGTKQLVTLIEVDGERLLLGVAGDRVSLVARLGSPAPAAASSTGPARDVTTSSGEVAGG